MGLKTMKRLVIESRIRAARGMIIEKIESAPLMYFFGGIVLGVVFAVFYSILIPAFVIAGLVILVFWMIGDQEESENTSETTSTTSTQNTQNTSNPVNGNAGRQSSTDMRDL
jgi:hypothetical protein